MRQKEISELDFKLNWHPCSQMKDYENYPIIPIKRGSGVYLYDFDGNSYIDAISSWWVNIFGHSNSYINQKIVEQLESLEHTIFAGFTHKPIVDLSSRLVDLMQNELKKCFYTDNGSSAVEVALKMSYHYFKNRGERRDLFLSLENSYHGETIGALSVGDVKLYKDSYSDILIKTLQTPLPKSNSLDDENDAIAHLEEILREYGDRISAFIFEPLIQCAGGMRFYSLSYLNRACDLAKKYDIFLIADEIAVGFGRGGDMFGSLALNQNVDFMLLSKALTGGYLPLAVVMTKNRIYDEFYAPYFENRAFLHSHSYTGNPLACAAANAVLDIFEKSDVLGENAKLSSFTKELLEDLSAFSMVKNIRIKGMISAFEIDGFKKEDRVGLKLHRYALNKGVLIRPLANSVYIMPPYVITEDEIEKLFFTIKSFLKQL